MTVIVALKDKENNKIYLGCDGQGTSGDTKLSWGRSKIIKLQIPVASDDDCTEITEYKTMYLGCSGSHYLQSYLDGAFHPPCINTDEDVVDYLYNQFFQVLNNELTLHTLLKTNDGALDSEASLIIVFDGEIYNVYSDFSIVQEARCFTCNGAGWKIAHGILVNLLEYHNDLPGKRMVEEALLTTGECNIYCNKEISVVEIELE